jgi:hypothetical protein
MFGGCVDHFLPRFVSYFELKPNGQGKNQGNGWGIKVLKKSPGEKKVRWVISLLSAEYPVIYYILYFIKNIVKKKGAQSEKFRRPGGY